MIPFPRNDYVTVRVIVLGVNPAGMKMPDNAIEGKEFIVENAGPDVKDLKKGDKVLMVAQRNSQYFDVPNHPGLIILKQEHIVLKMNEEAEDKPG